MSYPGERAAALALRNVTPRLAILRCGENEADGAYLRGALKRGALCGVDVAVRTLPETVSRQALLDAIDAVNGDASVHGCLLLRPLPPHLRDAEAEICGRLLPEKDVDGMTTRSLGALVTGAAGFAPCTAEACMELLRAHGIDPAGRRVTVVGRSLVIGRPAALLLTRADATVTLCHRKTPDLAARCRDADILLAAAGAPGLITTDFVRPGQIVLDAGATALPDGTLRGDVAPEAAAIAVCTPVPGGIGSVTTALLLRHTVQAAENLRHF